MTDYYREEEEAKTAWLVSRLKAGEILMSIPDPLTDPWLAPVFDFDFSPPILLGEPPIMYPPGFFGGVQ